jgi:hypothetical protein
MDTLAVTEATTPTYLANLVDKDGQPIAGSALTSLTLTYFQEYSEAIINGRSGQNVLQANGVTLDGNGVLTWELTKADTVISNNALAFDPHIARFDFTYPTNQTGRHEVRILVANLSMLGS